MVGATAEVLVLGVITAVRPATSQAAVIALLRAPAARRSLVAFVFAGILVSVAIGLIVVLGLDGARTATDPTTFGAVFNLIAGVAALSFAAGVHRGRIGRPRATPGRARNSKITERLRRPSALTAAAAGIATHIPGLIYLVVLNAIAAEQPTPGTALAQVATYNALWFALPLAALILAIRSPDAAGSYLDRAAVYARRNQDRLLIVLFGALGVYLTVKGIVHLV